MPKIRKTNLNNKLMTLNLFSKQKMGRLIALLVFCFFILFRADFFAHAYSPDLFVTRWKTDVAGATEPKKVTLSFLKAATDSYQVSWNCDGIFQEYDLNKVEHTYSSAGEYDICVKSTRPLHFYTHGLDNTKKEKAKLLEVKQWGQIPWSSFESAFRGATSMKLTATDTPNLLGVKNMSSAFEGATSFTGHESMNNWNTVNVTNMKAVFYGASLFNQDISNWKTENVENMSDMFFGATRFNNGDASGQSNKPLNNWITSKVTNMKGMFRGAASFNQNIGNWNLGKVTTVEGMFSGATRFNNGESAGLSNKPLNWNVEKVQNFGSMFQNARVFNQPIGAWNTSGATDMNRMFDRAYNFNQPLTQWNTENVTTMLAMFQYSHSFNQDLSHFNTSKVRDMNSMFFDAYDFNQDISSWNISSVVNTGGPRSFRNILGDPTYLPTEDYYFSNYSFSMENYEKLLKGWSSQTVKPNLQLDVPGCYYCSAEPYRNILTSGPNNWTISDAGKKCLEQDIKLSSNEIKENETEVGTITSTATTTVTFSLVSGEGDGDNTKFTLNATTGALAFSTAPDYENPTGSADPNDKNKYTIRVRATDAVGTIGLYSEKVFIITVLDVDNIPPEVSITSTVTINVANEKSYTLKGACTDGDGDVTIVVGGATYTTTCLTNSTWSTDIDLSTQLDGIVSIEISQTDAAGNKGTATKGLFKDATPPSVTINQASTQIDPSSVNSVRYTVIFSEKINEATFTKEDIFLSGSATAKVEKITKISDTEFEVEVNNLTKGDTIIATIPANALTDLATNG